MHSNARQCAWESCPVCGRDFVRWCTKKAWGYAYDGILVCSYKCMREMEKQSMETQAKTEDKGHRNTEILKLYKSGMSAKEIASRFNMSTQGVWYVIRNEKTKPGAAKGKQEAPEMQKEEKAVKEQPAMTEAQEDLMEQLEIEKSESERWHTKAMWARETAEAATKLMMAWKDRCNLIESLYKTDARIAIAEEAYFEALRKEGKEYAGDKKAKTDPAPEAGA